MSTATSFQVRASSGALCSTLFGAVLSIRETVTSTAVCPQGGEVPHHDVSTPTVTTSPSATAAKPYRALSIPTMSSTTAAKSVQPPVPLQPGPAEHRVWASLPWLP